MKLTWYRESEAEMEDWQGRIVTSWEKVKELYEIANMLCKPSLFWSAILICFLITTCCSLFRQILPPIISHH